MLSRFFPRRSFATLIGKQAPALSGNACMPDGSFKPVSLDEFKGKKYVVLYFWPADFTYVCASETIDFHKRMDEFKSLNCEVIGCSTDTVFTHKAWKATTKDNGGLGTPINHPMIGDINKQIAKDFDVLLDNGLACRGVFVIDKNGKVRSEMKNDLAIGRNVDEVLRTVESVVHTDTHGDEVCPAGWKKGKPAMKASHEGVTEYLKKYT